MTTKQISRAALVFGGSRGIGAAIVSRLAAEGYVVAFTFASSRDAAPKLVKLIMRALHLGEARRGLGGVVGQGGHIPGVQHLGCRGGGCQRLGRAAVWIATFPRG